MAEIVSKVQAERYWRDGYLFPIDVMSRDEASQYRNSLEALEAEYGTGTLLPKPLDQYLRINAHYVLPLAAELARHPRIADAVEAVLGPNLMVWSCEVFAKEAGSQRIVSWHQDLTYWGLGATEHEVTAWLALSPATAESGCMRFVAGSHTNEIVPHEDTFSADNLLSRGQEIAVEVDEAEAVNVSLQPGQMSLHHGRMFHASGPNLSDDRRIGIAIRFITPDVKPDAGRRDYAMLVRGIDLVQNFIHVAEPAENFAPAAMQTYEQVLADQSVALAAGADQAVGYYT